MMIDESHPSEFCLVLVTAGSEAEAKTIAEALVTEKLAACVNLYSITSVYTWQSQLQQDPEWQLTIKTHGSRFESLKARVQELHSYEVPEVIAIPIQSGSEPYLNWIAASVQ
jgi:periplasmic divalent cation tolerance protein